MKGDKGDMGTIGKPGQDGKDGRDGEKVCLCLYTCIFTTSLCTEAAAKSNESSCFCFTYLANTEENFHLL